jgi:hypothetical protein
MAGELGRLIADTDAPIQQLKNCPYQINSRPLVAKAGRGEAPPIESEMTRRMPLLCHSLAVDDLQRSLFRRAGLIALSLPKPASSRDTSWQLLGYAEC